MSSAAASGNAGAFILTSKLKGEVANFIRVKVIADPAGTTGATTVAVSGNDITVKAKCTDTTIDATKAELYSAMSGSAAAQNLVNVTTGAATGADTGAAFTGAGGAFVNLAGGAEGDTTVLYDDLAAVGGDAFTGPTGATRFSSGGLTHYRQTTATGNGAVAQSVDIFEVFDSADGSFHDIAAVAATGASTAVLAAGRTADKQVRKGGALGAPGYGR